MAGAQGPNTESTQTSVLNIDIRRSTYDKIGKTVNKEAEFNLSSYVWSEFYTTTKDGSFNTSSYNNNYTVPTLRLHAFQPLRRVYYTELIAIASLNAVGVALGAFAKNKFNKTVNANNTAKNIAEESKTSPSESAYSKVARNLLSPLADLAEAGGQAIIQRAAISAADDGINKGIEYLQALFKSGEWLQSYEVPFFSNAYLKADGNSGWSTGGIESIGSSASEIGKFLSDGFNINIPMQPTWTKPAAKEESDQISTTFFLLNNSLEAFSKNYLFLHSLMGHCYWVQLGYYMQSPNVFRVVVPGRFNFLWATIVIEVEVEGKMRPINPKNINDMPNVNLIPDAYKVKLTVNNLCPNNYNLFLNMLDKQSIVDKNILSSQDRGAHEAAKPGTPIDVVKVIKDLPAQLLRDAAAEAKRRLGGG